MGDVMSAVATPLDRAGFATFFEGLRGHEPFPWQQRLVSRLVEKPLDFAVPDVIAVPTGLGKTAVIDAWAYALAARVQSGAVALPRRLCLVVDRRLVVDDAAAHARELAGALASAAAQPGTRDDGRERVAVTLAGFSGHGADPLRVVAMRGGLTWDSRWLPRPDQPAVVVGTVDQFGSRLLFRGYTQSQRLRPVDAALTGLDTWLVVDEAHLAGPLRQTVEGVVAHQRRMPLERDHQLRLTRMSATPGQASSPLVATAETETEAGDLPRAAAEAATRLRSTKPTCLIELDHLSAAPGRRWREKSRQLGEALAELARGLAEAGAVVGVVANTVGTARAAFDALRDHGESAALLVGRCREFERDAVVDRWMPVVEVGAPRDEGARRFVVATQTIEVGVNLDLDAIVSECAPLTSLVQRFGRVNRVGVRAPRTSAVVRAGFAHDDDPVYGDATAATWELLVAEAGEHATVRRREIARRWPEAALDFGAAEADRLRRRADERTAVAETPTPIVTGAQLERWAQTSPQPEPDQPVAAFLHGVDRGTPDVAVAWRAAPPPAADDVSDLQRWRRWLELAPPVAWEFVEVPVWEVRGLLAASAPATPTADIEGVVRVAGGEEVGADEAAASAAMLGIVERPGAEPQPVRSPADVTPGDRVVLSSELGGHDEWGWTGASQPDPSPAVPDVGDLAPTRRHGLRRMAWEVMASWGVVDDDGAVREALSEVGGDDADLPAVIGRVIDGLITAGTGNRELEPLINAFDEARGWSVTTAELLGPGGNGQVAVLVDRRARQQQVGAVADDDEASTSQTSEQAVPLAQHGESVAMRARELAVNLGLADELVAAVELAARWHDLGKADERFQMMLHDGDRLAAAAAAEPLAKSGRDPRDPIARAARRVAGVPRGFRHEARSARLAANLLQEGGDLGSDADGELVVHLVASHHGWARPLLPPLIDADAAPLEMDIDGRRAVDLGGPRQVDWTHPGRLQRLHDRYGWWGVALLETVVRLADMGCSEEGR
jgi:CRISPR-associated endonuclease/helicase Cas3